MSQLLSIDDFAIICEFIYRNSGISLDNKHYNSLSKYIITRIKYLELNSFKEYFFKLRFDDKHGNEFQKLINKITVNDTYFFREKNQFEILVDKILPELNKNVISKKDSIRILFAPCSSGEEAYSALIHILEEKITKNLKIELVGIDIDSEVIKQAKEAKYCKKSVNAIPKDILSKYFIEKSSEYAPIKKIKESVDFRIVNIFDKIQMEKLGKFDVIFSRNMFIYFDDESRKEVATIFYDMLNKNGYIFLGSSEKMHRIISIFNTKKIDNTIIYQK